MKRKAFLAKVLAAAVAVTSVLPSGLVAEAATIKNETKRTDWEANAEASWGPAAEGESAFDGKLNVGGFQSWHFKATEATGNHNNNGDFTASDAPSLAIADAINIATVEGADARELTFDLYPYQGTIANIRFAIMLKYVDAENWASLGHDPKGWYYEYRIGDDTSYTSKFSELHSLDEERYTRVKLTYTASDTINIEMTKLQEGPEVDGKPTLVPAENETPVTKELQQDSLATLRTVAEQKATEAGESGPKICFGFKGGTWDGSITELNIVNVRTNADCDPGEDRVLAFNNCGWEWVNEATKGTFDSENPIGGVNYVTIDGGVSGKTVYEGSTTGFEEGTVSAVLRPYTVNAQGEAVAATQAFYLDAKYTPAGEATTATGIKVGFNGTKWGYQIGDATFVAKDAVTLAPMGRQDYTVSLEVTKDEKLIASVTPVVAEGEETTTYDIVSAADNVSVADLAAGSVGVTAGAGLSLRVRDFDYTHEITRTTPALQTTVDTIETETKNNAEFTYYKENWETFVAELNAAKTFLEPDDDVDADEAATKNTALTTAYNTLKNEGTVSKTELENALNAAKNGKVESDYTAESWTEFQNKLKEATDLIAKINAKNELIEKSKVTTAITNMETAADVLVEVPASAEEKAGLQNLVNEAVSVKDTEKDLYDTALWDAFVAAREEAKTVSEKANASKKEVADALAKLQAAKSSLVPRKASEEETAAFKGEVDKIKASANKKYTAESLKVYQDALAAAEKLLADGNATKKALDEALAKLQAAKAALKEDTGSVTPKPPVPTPGLKKGETKTVGNATYKVLDADKKTVELTKGDAKAKSAKIDKVKIDGIDCTVVSIGANAFKGAKNLTSVTIGTGVTSIGKNAFASAKKLKSVVVGKAVKTIGASAFSGCKKLAKVTFKGTAVSKIQGKAFKGTAKKVTVKIPKSLKKNKKKATAFKKKLTKAGMSKKLKLK